MGVADKGTRVPRVVCHTTCHHRLVFNMLVCNTLQVGPHLHSWDKDRVRVMNWSMGPMGFQANRF